ncbi:MAG: DGQHR domain-containing protein, partial [Myxococcales bacterium]|nr:DGQHR domain-containing protein [Myxococcales bacterium]
AFHPLGGGIETIGHLELPCEKFLIIDGQHRLAALRFYLTAAPQEAETIHVPCTIFDGHNEDFATEMFVIINSTPTRINKSHLVDLYERISWTTADSKLAARVVQLLYERADSPLQYKINRLGGRSRQAKWILQAELFNEIHRWVREDEARGFAMPKDSGLREREAERRFYILADFLHAAADVWGETWGNDRYMVTKPVTLKAMLRVAFELASEDAEPESGRFERWRNRLQPWSNLKSEFRADGFYERFPAKGQVERTARLHRHLLRHARLPEAAGNTKSRNAD